ncbi:sensor histidine kinase [Hydrogenophaga sp.]|uniref:sensor histidine kinase n=1 Tax=Hydrogenophaga sp. TaxID=1904254 RepID=UPI003F72B3CE
MRRRTRLLLTLVALLTLASTGLLWLQSERARSVQREQMLEQAAQRSLQLADAMANQVDALVSVLDQELIGLRREWMRNPMHFDAEVQAVLTALPRQFVSHVSLIDAQGYMVYNSRGVIDRMYLGDRDHFQTLQRSGRDDLYIGKPVQSKLVDDWVFVISRPLMLEGRFGGTLQFLVSTEFVARRLAALQLESSDVVSLIHRDGWFMARSLDNSNAMGNQVPADRPFLTAQADIDRGIFRVPGRIDGTQRTYGWRRLAGSDLIVGVGLEEASILAPLETGFGSARALTGLLALLLLLCGGLIVWLLLRAEHAQDALKNSEARLKEAQRLAHLGSWQVDLNNERVTWSDEVFRILDVDPATHAASFKHFIEVVHPDDQVFVKEAYRLSVSTRKPYDFTHRLLMRDGQVKHVREVGFTQFEGERPTRSVGTLQDITEVHLAEEALRKLNEELEARVAGRTRELSLLNRELEAFAYSVSHDLRTPLRTIDGFARVIEEDDGDKLSPQGRGHLRRIIAAVHRMGRLTSDLLALAQVSRAELRLEPVDLSAMARTVADELARSDADRTVDWRIEDDLQVTADPGLMRVVMENLLGNAWKYTGQTPHARIEFRRSPHARADGAPEFCVRDNGAGFDMTYAAQLFEPFKRLHRPQEFEGSGVGLATVHRVIERHGGHVRGEGTVGQGAAFYFSVAAPGR